MKKWTPSPLTLILLGLIAYLWFRPPAEVSEENRAASPWQAALTDGSNQVDLVYRVEEGAKVKVKDINLTTCK